MSSPETVNPDLLKRTWSAQWITSPGAQLREFGVFRFRKTFDLPAQPTAFRIHVSGDNRYELFVNGTRVSAGPARGDLNHWRFDTIDIAPNLKKGKNILAAVVWNFAELAPMAQIMNETGFILQGDSTAESIADTGTGWKVVRDSAIGMIPLDRKKIPHYTVVGPGERVDGTKYPWGWESAEYNDSSWNAPRVLTPGGPRGIQDSPSRWMLVPRNIPLMEEKLERLNRIVKAGGVTATEAFLKGQAPITIPPGSRATLLLDNGALTTAYPELISSGGRGSLITLTYAEALWKGNEKGNRNETEGKDMVGYQDRFIPDGGSGRLFRPLWWRTYRYLQINVETHTEPLVLQDFRGKFTAYPFVVRARFESDDPNLGRIWETGWRTARLCAHETYMDCPYYEQLQYAGDTRIQALISLYVAGDNRLVKNAIELLDESRTPEGLTQSRYPSFLPQYIPPFSLLWIGMMHDLWWYSGEQAFLKGYLPGVHSVLGWFESRLSSSGLLGKLEWWNFVDWTREFSSGVPPQESDGQSAILSLQFAAALRDASDLESSFGSPERAAHYSELARKICSAVRETCWDAERRLVADSPSRRYFSQHANVLSILEDVLPDKEQVELMRRVLDDPKLPQCTYYFRFYLFRALKKTGLGDEYLKLLDPWRHMLALGLTTWAEEPEPSRSDCHAWSAHPNFDLIATVAGIEPAAPGFSEVVISPHPGTLTTLRVSMPHPQGEISVRLARKGDQLDADVTLPGTLAGKFVWKGKQVVLHPGPQHVTVD
ncbi:MAG TPA: alpha-L-rhamnosidase C-terminal domain-containing protein [Acidobacteriota bacterium]|nr:alpha-L-rhamnosidase C-terminal domain-containing protein [Acidobacteriota bacterium]